MSISISYLSQGIEAKTSFLGVATISENPPLLKLLVTDHMWTALQEVLGGSMIMALTLDSTEGGADDRSILYHKVDEERDRIPNYVFRDAYPSSDMSRVEAQVQTTLLKSEQKRKDKPAEWKWSGNRHGH